MKDSVSPYIRGILVIPVKKNEEIAPKVKLVNLIKPATKTKVLLPPQQEQYIKAKKHDFL